MEGSLWTPGNGFTTTRERQVARAIEEYESDLLLGQNRETNEWVVYLRNGPHSHGQPFPIFGLGRELPSADKVKEMLYKADIRRKGTKIYEQVFAANRRAENASRKVADEASEQMAEAIVEGFRTQGFDPFHRSLPNKHPKNRKKV